MNETSWAVRKDPLGVDVTFDVREQENCLISLFFTKEDIETLMLLDTFGKYRADLEGIKGNVTRSRGDIDKNNLTFTYSNGGVDYFGTVCYNHRKVKDIMTAAIEEIWALELDEDNEF